MRKKVLFIDDDPTILLISKLMLEDLGYDVIIAEGGVIGIEMLKKNNKNNDIDDNGPQPKGRDNDLPAIQR